MEHSFLHMVSLGLTPFVYFSLAVVLTHYAAAAWQNKRPTTAGHWLILGIVISMLFKVPDNSFWNGSWSAYLFGEPKPWFEWGPPVNIIFRQLPIIAACACHWYAEYRTAGQVRWRLVIGSAVFAVLWFIAMTSLGAFN
jgi:hypothetical protein